MISRTAQAPVFSGSLSKTQNSAETVRKTEFLMDVPLFASGYKQYSTSEPGFYCMTYSLNPAETGTFKILPGIAENYQQMRANGIRLIYEAIQGASQQGRGVAYISTDPTRLPPTSMAEAEQADGAMKFPFITGTELSFGPSSFNQTPPVKQIREPDDPAESNDDPLITAGRLVICTAGSTVSGTSTALPVGRLLIHYDFSLSKQIDGSEAGVKTGWAKWADSTTYHLSMTLGKQTGHHLAFYDKPDNTVYGSTGPWLCVRNSRVARIVVLTGVNSGAWTTATDLNVYTSEHGNTYIDDAAAATQLFQNATTGGNGVFVYFIPRGTKYVALHVAYAVVTAIRMFTFPIRRTVTF